MATKKRPDMFPNYDFSQFAVDPSAFMSDFMKVAGEFQVPGLDYQSIIDSQQKNVEALNHANQVAIEGAQALMTRQAEILQQTMEEAIDAVKSIGDSESPQDLTAKQADLVREAYEKALVNMRELAELATKSNSEAAEAINARIAESLDEVKELALKYKS